MPPRAAAVRREEQVLKNSYQFHLGEIKKRIDDMLAQTAAVVDGFESELKEVAQLYRDGRQRVRDLKATSDSLQQQIDSVVSGQWLTDP